MQLPQDLNLITSTTCRVPATSHHSSQKPSATPVSPFATTTAKTNKPPRCCSPTSLITKTSPTSSKSWRCRQTVRWKRSWNRWTWSSYKHADESSTLVRLAGELRRLARHPQLADLSAATCVRRLAAQMVLPKACSPDFTEERFLRGRPHVVRGTHD